MADPEEIEGTFKEAKESGGFRAGMKKSGGRLFEFIFGFIFRIILERALLWGLAIVFTLVVGVSIKLYGRWVEAGTTTEKLTLVENTERKSFAVAEKPFKAFNRAISGKQKISVHDLRANAKQGFKKPQYQLGLLYFTGNDHLVEKDMVQAVAWWYKSAAQGYAAAQNALGFAYWRGEGVEEEDREKAVAWYKLAAEQNLSLAQYNLGVAYWKGEGVAKKDVAEAVRLWRLAAEEGLPEAQYDLAEALWKGEGAEKSEKDAQEWYEKAADKGHLQASFRLGQILKDKKKLPKAMKWLRQAAKEGLGAAQYAMGVAYEKGVGVAPSYREAYYWFSLAAVTGHGDAVQKRDDTKQRLDQDTIWAADNDVNAQQEKITEGYESKEKAQQEYFLVTNQ